MKVKERMKKLLAIFLVVAMIFALSACGDAEGEKSKTPGMTDKNNGMPSPRPYAHYSIPNEVLVDNDFIRVTVTDAYVDDEDRLVIELPSENKTDETLIFNFKNISINGYMSWGDWGSIVAGGEEIIRMVFYPSTLESLNVDVAEEIAFDFYITFYEAEEEEPIYDVEHFALYPTGLDASSVHYPERTPAKGETVLLDNDDFKFVIEGLNEYKKEGETTHYFIQIYMENRTENATNISLSLLKVNGYVLIVDDETMTIPSGKRANYQWCFSKELFDKNEINEIEEFEFLLDVWEKNKEGYHTNTILNEIITYKP